MGRQARECLGRGTVRGQVVLWNYDERTRRRRPHGFRRNQIQDGWMFVAAQAAGGGLAAYAISGVYLEFENVADPGDPVTVPTFTRVEGPEYYENLAFSSTRDFIRTPLLQKPLLGIEPGYEDSFVAGVSGNLLTFFAMSGGTIGVHGKPFNDSVNSKVFGVALVATPLLSDRTHDIVFARTYFDSSEQVVKEASHQIGVTWDIAFLRPT